ncbi:Cytochrome P450 [Rhynchospora pubera]|uniref:Cytochrome P450 n=1 Tax=Rhynchospora pubera TaxID=906938 RepID=A0AAV8GVH4_9POAL|nr:Cytochrome P450 [Rhynchospora pubera]
MASLPIEQAFSSSALFLISLASFVFLILLFTRSKPSKNLPNPPPSPPKLPILGNLHQLGTLAHRSLQELSKIYGPIMLIHLGEIPTLVVSNARMAREVLKTHDAVFASRPLLKAATILAYNHHDLAFAPYGDQWRSLRKITNMHVLSSKRVVHTFRHFREEEVAFMVDKIHKDATTSPDGIVNMRNTFYKFTNDIICHMMTGNSFRKDGREEKLMNIVVDSIPLLGKFNPEDFFPSLKWVGRLLGAKVRAEAWKTFKVGDAMMTEVLKDRVEGRTEGNEDFLDILLKLQKDENQKKEFEIKDEHVKALCYQSLAAGSEPLALSLEWTMIELLRHPRVLKKLQEEVRGITSQNDLLTSEDVSNLTYLKAAMTESFRLHPPTPLLIPRESMDYCNIEGYDVPKGSRVFVNTYAMGRDPEVWDNPLEYRPERFVNNPFNYNSYTCEIVPFGGGRRICPGMQLSLLTMELALANLLWRFDWELPKGMKPEDVDMSEMPSLSLKRKAELELVAKPRQITS